MIQHKKRLFFNTITIHIAIIYQKCMGRMDEEQAVFEQLSLSNHKKWNSTALKAFNSSTIIMTSNSDKIRMSCVWCFWLYCCFWVNSTPCSGEFHAVFKHFQNLENLILNILKKKCISFVSKFYFAINTNERILYKA